MRQQDEEKDDTILELKVRGVHRGGRRCCCLLGTGALWQQPAMGRCRAACLHLAWGFS